MGEVEIDKDHHSLIIYSHIITYGNAADETIANRIGKEIERMWNHPEVTVLIKNQGLHIKFKITAEYQSELTELEVLQNDNPRNNYFRIEDYIHGNISFVDGIGCNTGFFLLENLYDGSTTAAHEYGHTIGLDHPFNLDIRGLGIPGIMYPRGTLVDPPFQYDPEKRAGTTGGTMHPMHRKVHKEDLDLLKLHRLIYNNGKAIIGNFTNVYHYPHPRQY